MTMTENKTNKLFYARSSFGRFTTDLEAGQYAQQNIGVTWQQVQNLAKEYDAQLIDMKHHSKPPSDFERGRTSQVADIMTELQEQVTQSIANDDTERKYKYQGIIEILKTLKSVNYETEKEQSTGQSVNAGLDY